MTDGNLIKFEQYFMIDSGQEALIIKYSELLLLALNQENEKLGRTTDSLSMDLTVDEYFADRKRLTLRAWVYKNAEKENLGNP